MSLIVVITAALLPAILLWLYIWKKDPQPESTSWLVKAIVWGMAICVPVAFLEMLIQTMFWGIDGEPITFIGSTIQAFVVVALPEESFKFLALWLVLRMNPYFDEHFDGIVYAVCVGLGFAAVENIFYVFSEEDWVSVAISRALLAVPGHYAFAILMGYYYSVYHFVAHTPKVAACILLVPVAAHGVYDALVMSGLVDPYIGWLSFFVLIWFCVKMHKVAKEKITAVIEKDNKQNNIVA